MRGTLIRGIAVVALAAGAFVADHALRFSVVATSLVAAPGCSNPPTKPEQPTLSNVAAPTNSEISGDITACVDDGYPNPPGVCTQEIILLSGQGGGGCTQISISSWSCALPYVTSAVPDASGSWSFVDQVAADAIYTVVGLSYDGGNMVFSDEVVVQTPTTVAGCFKHSAIQRTLFAEPGDPGIGLQNGAIAGFQIQPKTAVDALFGGFTQQAIWVGVDGGSNQQEWIETGVTQGIEIVPGVPADAHRYFTAWGDSGGNGGFIAIPMPGAPIPAANGQLEFFKVVDCSSSTSGFPDQGCPGNDLSPDTWLTCVDTGQVGNDTTNCVLWSSSLVEQLIPNLQIDPIDGGSADIHVGMESTCGLSSVDTAKIEQTRYRTNTLQWANIENIDWMKTFIAKEPSPSSVHGLDCCNGLITLPGNTNSECQSPKEVIYFHNSSTSTNPAQACN